MLAYSGERITSSAARLHPYFPFLAVTATASVVLFKPQPGQHLGERGFGSSCPGRLADAACTAPGAALPSHVQM